MLIREILLEKFPTFDLNEIIEKLQDDDSKLYSIHFSNVKKLGIDPLVMNYVDTPIGIYGYPLKYTKNRYKNLLEYPYANDRNYIILFSIRNSAKVLELDNKIPFEYFEKLKKYYKKEIKEKIDEDKLNDKKVKEELEEVEFIIEKNINKRYIENSYFIRLINSILKLKKEFLNPAFRTFVLRKILEIDVLIDPGYSIIHQNEPAQLVVLNPKVIENVEIFKNPFKETIDKLKKENKPIPIIVPSKKDFLEDAHYTFLNFLNSKDLEKKRRYFHKFINDLLKGFSLWKKMFDYEQVTEKFFHYVKKYDNVFDFYKELLIKKSEFYEIVKEFIEAKYLKKDLKYISYHLNMENEKVDRKYAEFLDFLRKKEKLNEFFNKENLKYFPEGLVDNENFRKVFVENIKSRSNFFEILSMQYPETFFEVLTILKDKIIQVLKEEKLFTNKLFEAFCNLYENYSKKSLNYIYDFLIEPFFTSEKNIKKSIIEIIQNILDENLIQKCDFNKIEKLIDLIVKLKNYDNFSKIFSTEENRLKFEKNFDFKWKDFQKIMKNIHV